VIRDRWLVELALWLVPAPWRDAVRIDLMDEAAAERRGALWRAWHAARAALHMRVSFRGDTMLIDTRYAIRSLLHAKGFTLAAVFTLVLGLGVNLAVFAVVDRVLFRPLPFAHADRLVIVTPWTPEDATRYTSFSKHLFVESRRQVAAIEDMAFAGFTFPHTIGGAGTEMPPLGLIEASYNLLDVLGTVPVLGRGFQLDDVNAGRDLAMLTYETWQTTFGGSPDVIGRTVSYSRSTRTIVGVLPPGFIAPTLSRSARADGLFLVREPLDSYKPRDAVDPAVARLAPGMTIPVAQEQFDAVATRLDPVLRVPNQNRGPRVLVEPLRAGMFWNAYRYFWLVALAATLVGLLACANLSGLLLARGRARARDIAMRASLGATRARLLATELLQSLIVAGAAAAIALLALYWTTSGLQALVPGFLRPFVLDYIDARVLGFAAAATLVAALVGGVVPAWRASRTDLLSVLQSAGGAAGHARTTHAGRVLLAFEAAVGIVLVAGAAVMLRSFLGLSRVDLGFDLDRLHVIRAGPPGTGRRGEDPASVARYRGMLDVIRRHHGVVAAGGVDSMPSAGAAPMTGARDWNGQPGHIGLWQVSDGFLTTIGARFLAGQDISVDDVNQTRPVAVVTEQAVRRLWPGTAPEAVLGRQLTATGQPVRHVIGVVADMRDSPTRGADPRIFAAVMPEGFWYFEFAVRTGAPTLEINSLRAALAQSHGATGVSMTAAGGTRTSVLQQPRMQAIIFGSFAVVALLLAALGLFAIASFDAARRRYELGVRVSLGATAAEIRRLMIRDSLRPVVAGAVAGISIAWWTATYAESLVHQVDVRDPWTLAMVAGVLVVTAVLAAWIPASRAARVDPIVTLRAQ
jgi:predicted permease